MPPRPMPLWLHACLEGIAPRFGLRHMTTWTEPLQELGWYQTAQEQRYLHGRIQRTLYYRLGFDRFFREYITAAALTILGHTVLAHFLKMKGG